MGEKRETLEQLARREADAEREREARRQQLLANAERLAKEVPQRFFQLVDELRAALERFNGAADPSRRISWRESAALAARDTSNLNADFNCALERPGAEVVLVLQSLGRAGKPDAYLMQASGRLRDDGFLLRVEGFVPKKDVEYRVSVNFRRTPYGIDELAERLVRAVVTTQVNELTG